MTKKIYNKFWNRKNIYLYDYYKKIDLLINNIPNEEIQLLDVGCGNGIVAKEILRQRPKVKIVGLDISSSAISEAKKLNPESVFYEIGNDGLFPVKNNSVDFIFCSEVIEHIYDTSTFMTEINRVIKPRGKILLTTPYHNVIKNILIALFGFERHYNPASEHIRFYTKNSLLRVFKDYSFEPEKIFFYGQLFPIPWSICVVAISNKNTNYEK